MKSQRIRISAIALTLALTITATFLTALPVTHAAVQPTEAFLFFEPNPIGVNQYLTVEAWVSPRPQTAADYYYKYMFTFTAPDGTIDTVGPLRSEHPGTIWFYYQPKQIGAYTVKFSWDGSDTPIGPSGARGPCSVTLPLTVQQQPIQSWPAAPLPTDGWNWPVNPENREWASITGPWYGRGYNGSNANFNPYSQAPASSHILWMLPPVSGLGGMESAPYSQYVIGRSAISLSAVMIGRGYYTTGGNIVCIDIRTGTELWRRPGSFDTASLGTPGTISSYGYTSGYTPTPVLISYSGSRLIKYDALTGNPTLNVTGAPSGVSAAMWQDPYVYSVANFTRSNYMTWDNATYHGSGARIIKWMTNSSTTTWANRVVWNVTWPYGTGFSGILNAPSDAIIYGDYIFQRENLFVNGNLGTQVPAIGAIYTKNGSQVFPRKLPDPVNLPDGPSTEGPNVAAYNNLFLMATGSYGARRYMAIDMKTGNIAWLSDQAAYPWGDFWAYQVGAAYGMVYAASYAGVYAWNATNGHQVWNYTSGSSMQWGETPYGTWPFYSGTVIAGGIVYAGTSEWGTPAPYYRGQKLHAIDAYTGKGLWNIMGSWSVRGPVAEGNLYASNNYDGHLYAFGRGPTLTEVSTDVSRISGGESVWIKGRVTDQSPAQPGTPAVSKDSMSAWLEYLHMQQPLPLDTVGVPVDIYVSLPNGTTSKLVTVTSDGQGYYEYKWTPLNEELYYISAHFNGDESYYSSWNLTSLTVGQAPAAQPEYPQPIAPIDYTPMFAGIIVAIVVLAVLSAFSIFSIRKLRK